MKLEKKYDLFGHEGKVWTVDWSKEGLLASGGEDRKIKIWKDFDGVWKCWRTIETTHKRTIRRIKWSSCQKKILCSSFDGTVSIWDVYKSFKLISLLEGHENEVKCADWSFNQIFIATCSRDKTIWIWEASNDDYECCSILNNHTQDIKMVKWHPKHDVLFSCSYDNTIRGFIQDYDEDWYCLTTLIGHTSTVWALDFNKEGNMMASCSEDMSIIIWKNSTDCKEPEQLKAWLQVQIISGIQNRPVYDIAWSKESSGENLASASGDNLIRVFVQHSDLQLHFSLSLSHENDVNAVSWHPLNKSLLASASDDEKIIIWCLNYNN